MKKKKSLRNPKAIASDPERVNRILRELAERRDSDYREFSDDYDRDDPSGALRSRRYRNAAGPMNTDRPYNGGLPGLGKGN